MNHDHIVALAQPSEAFKCLHCGQVQQISMPVSVSLICSIEKAFRKEHLKCQPAPCQKQAA